MNPVAVMAAIITVIATVAGGVYALDQQYARKANVKYVAARLEQKIREDRLANLQERKWRLEDRYGTNCGRMKDECRALQQTIDRLKRQLSK